MNSMIALQDNIFGEQLIEGKPKVGAITLHDRPGIRIWAPDIEGCIINVFLNCDDVDPLYCEQMAEEGAGYFSHIFNYNAECYYYALELPCGALIPDPYGHELATNVHGRSKFVPADILKYPPKDWHGTLNENLIIQEIHIGTFTNEGTFAACEKKLGDLKKTGFTAIQLMPINSVPGKRNWGYDQVSFFCLNNQYGSINDLRSLIEAAHQLGLAVIYDAVFNHLGPEGNYHSKIASSIEAHERDTPWGSGLGLNHYYHSTIESIVCDAVEYWIGNIGFDGIRLDAADHLCLSGDTGFLQKIFETVKNNCSHVNYISILEGDAGKLNPLGLVTLREKHPNLSIWNEAILPSTDNKTARYGEAENIITEQSSVIPIFSKETELQFINFLRSHDTIGNTNQAKRNRGNQKAHYLTLLPLLLLTPSIPMIFMGDQWLSDSPFHFFCDFQDITAQQLLMSRSEEFKTDFSCCPPALSEDAFLLSKLDWAERSLVYNRQVEKLIRTLIDIRKKTISQFIANISCSKIIQYGSGQNLRWKNQSGDELIIKLIKSKEMHDDNVQIKNLIFENKNIVREYGLPFATFVYMKIFS